jgi:hypothetical protein
MRDSSSMAAQSIPGKPSLLKNALTGEAWRWLATRKRWLYLSAVFHTVCALVLIPVTSHPYDLVSITGPTEAWLNWGFSPLYNWKFGVDYTALALLAQSLRAFLATVGVPGVIALHLGWKLPLVAANLLTAGAIYRLGLRLAPDRAVSVASLWLVNPAVLWVSAGHGQIESIAILCIFASLQLALDGWPFAAGIVTGLGVGIEYFPLAVAGVIAVWALGGQLRGRQPVIRYGVGLLVSVIVCFAPLLIDPVGRTGLIAGLAFSGGLTSDGTSNGAATISLVSAWAWLSGRGAQFWPLLLVVAGIVAFLASVVRAGRGPQVGVLFLGSALILAVLLDSNSLPQFAVIGAAALCLFAVGVQTPPLALITVPAAGLATYLLFLDRGINANAFFFDVGVNGQNLWAIPVSERAAEFLGRLFSLGLVATAFFSGIRLFKASSRDQTLAAGIGVAICLSLVIWVSQPPIWRAALSQPPTADSPDFAIFTATRVGTTATRSPGVVDVTYPDALVRTAITSRVQPSSELAVSVRDLYGQQEADTAATPSVWPDRRVLIPNWGRQEPSIRFLWVELLLGSTDWTTASNLNPNELTLLVNGATNRATYARIQSPGWALVDFQIPSSQVSIDGGLDLLPGPSSLLWNGSAKGPWVRVIPSSGEIAIQVDQSPIMATYQLAPNGEGWLSGFPIRREYIVDIASAAIPISAAQAAVLRWPLTSNTWLYNFWIETLGGLFGLSLIGATVFGLLRYFRVPDRRAKLTSSPPQSDG